MKKLNSAYQIDALDEEMSKLSDKKLAGEKNPRAMLGLNNVLSMHGVRINYADSALK